MKLSSWKKDDRKTKIDSSQLLIINLYNIYFSVDFWLLSLQQFEKLRRCKYQKKLEKNFLLLGWPISLLSDSHFYHTILISIFLIVVPTLRFSSIYMCLCVSVRLWAFHFILFYFFAASCISTLMPFNHSLWAAQEVFAKSWTYVHQK